ncbi:MAG: PBSX family phage terminase large subunit [Ruminiclostridium sp.]|nr:PBSX family phage terminase large subunit [Ruminiclostridium sp.]
MTISEQNNLRLSQLIAPAFYGIHCDIAEQLHTHYVLCGGRGSCKSSFVSIEIILGIMNDENANGAVIRKVGQYLRDSVFEQLLWAVEKLGVSDLWESKVTTPELIYKPTGQRILFRGADKPRKLKSTKVAKGYIKYVWYEETDEFSGQEEIDSINQSLLRGGDSFCCFYSFNPPKDKNNWVNVMCSEPRKDRLVHRSDYRTVPEEWLGQQFIAEAEYLKIKNPLRYENEYLGEATGTGAEIFPNVSIREITDEEIEGGGRFCRGLDWGYGADPFVYLCLIYDKNRREILIYHEFYRYGAKYDEIAEEIRAENPHGAMLIAESAEPRSNDELRARGIRLKPAKKGAGSVEYGIRWLQNLNAVVIDPVRCPNAAREFRSYRFPPDGNGGYRSEFPDRDNHTIDAARYALEDEAGRKTAVISDRRRLGIF